MAGRVRLVVVMFVIVSVGIILLAFQVLWVADKTGATRARRRPKIK